MRNGMSVKEIYDKLDGYDRLQAAYMAERDRNGKVLMMLQEMIKTIDSTASDYTKISWLTSNHYEDRVEFKHRALGLIEAHGTIERIANKYGIKLD